jgi:hypothetical protein
MNPRGVSLNVTFRNRTLRLHEVVLQAVDRGLSALGVSQLQTLVDHLHHLRYWSHPSLLRALGFPCHAWHVSHHPLVGNRARRHRRHLHGTKVLAAADLAAKIGVATTDPCKRPSPDVFECIA